MILSHGVAVLAGILLGSAIDWESVKRDGSGFRYLLAAVVLLVLVAAFILATRGGGR
jgi:membrane protein DedA with SNARE-associated domain